MKKLLHLICLALLISAPAVGLKAADTPRKTEMRSAWVATVWRLDWPSYPISSTGNASQIQRQKDDMTRLLDSLHNNNMNAINFQVRSRCDAMYKSSYEPWSSDLVESRGMDPGYDPLAFVVEECHKRGMECHAWLNPYRYESVIGSWNGMPGDYRKEHPDWLIDTGSASILNPGKPEVTQRICDIIAEIVTNYDVDGVLFDDYFYLSGTKDEMDDDLYSAYTEAGGTLGRGDWRRDNVNRMVAAVYKTIKSIKPYLRFGISPAGIACTNATVAGKYGIPACPTGSDWQYNDIYSDPVAWISEQSLDYISPQIYWTIGHTTDYDRATKWWSEITAKWNRHMYVSHSISSLNSQSKIKGLSAIESDLNTLADGPNKTSFEEFANEVRLNREYTVNDAPGSIFYSCKYLYANAPLFAHYLKTTVFNTPALMPAMTWHPVSNPGNVSDVVRSGNKLSWKGLEGMRYTVYAVPQSVGKDNFFKQTEYLLGVSYDESYVIPDQYLTGHEYAVCVYDRYSNEYNPMFVGAASKTLAAPKLTSPCGGVTIEQPFDFEWQGVDDATGYIIEISDSEAMTDLLYVKAVEGTSCSSTQFFKLPIKTKLYWRVHSCGNNCNDGISAVESFESINLEITAPYDGQTDVSLTPTITWPIEDREVTVRVARSAAFGANDIVYEATARGGSLTVPKHHLSYYTTYYVQLQYQRSGEDCVTPTVTFTTGEGDIIVPAVVYPADGATLFSNERIRLAEMEGHNLLRMEICADTKFSSRSIYISNSFDAFSFENNDAGKDIKINGKALADGTTYYIRVRAQYATSEGSATTEYSPISSFVYSAAEGSVSDITVDENDGEAVLYSIEGIRVENPTPGIYIERRGSVSKKVIIK